MNQESSERRNTVMNQNHIYKQEALLSTRKDILNEMRAYDSQKLTALKQYVLAHPSDIPDDLTDMELKLVKSWLYSYSLGVDCRQESLRDDQIDFTTKDRLTSFLLYEWKQRRIYYSIKHELLAEHGAVVYYVDPHHCIYSHGGNKALLARLKQKGIKFGADLSDESIGTNAMTFLHHPHPVSFMRGAMNYSRVFSEYVTIAMDFSFKNYNGMCQFIVFPEEKLTWHLLSVIQAVHCMEQYHLMNVDSDVTNLRSSAMNLTFTNAVLLIDANGYVMDSNCTFLDLFDTTYFDIVGKKLSDAFPEMADVLQLLQTGTEGQFFITYHEQHFQLICRPVIQNGLSYGIIVQASPALPKAVPAHPVSPRMTFSFQKMVGSSPAFLKAKNKAVMVSYSDCNIMLCGESGTGKEVFAQSIHGASPRAQKPFVAINCAAIPKDLIVSELFGYEEGAFTGSKKSGNPGKFEQADGGTLFLDEITEMPLDMQAVLLRVLETGEVVRLGGQKSRHVNVRIITATNRNIEDFVAQGHFRLDLYYRLNVIKINIPPLRERKEDIPQAAQTYVDHFADAMGQKAITIAPEAMKCLCAYSWPGNMRQLRNAMEAAVTLAHSHIITSLELPEYILEDAAVAAVCKPAGPKGRPVPEPVQESVREKTDGPAQPEPEAERPFQTLKEVLAACRGNKSKTAETMGISRSTLYRHLRKARKGEAPAEAAREPRQKPDIRSYASYRDYERDLIYYLLDRYHGNKSRVAAVMGISKSTLYRRLKE